jgi:hypothetical protein
MLSVSGHIFSPANGTGATFLRRCETRGPISIARHRLSFIIRVALIVVGLSTYFIDPDDVVWRFVKAASHARVLEHICFGTAAAILGLALLLKMKASVDATKQEIHDPSRIRGAAVSLLEAIGIGSLLPLPGFLLLVLGDLGVSLLLYGLHPTAEDPEARLDSHRNLQAFRWRDALATHLGLCCAFFSMLLFSVMLIDRVADVLFAVTALISIADKSRRVLTRAGHS